MLLDAREEYPQGLNAAIRTAARPGGSVRRVRPALFGRGAGRGPGGHHGHAGQRAGRVSVRGQAVCARQRAGRRGRHHGRRTHCGGRHGGRRRGLCHARRRNLCARQRGLPRGRAYEGLRHKAAGAGNWRAGGQFSGRISGGRHHCGAEPGHGKQRPGRALLRHGHVRRKKFTCAARCWCQTFPTGWCAARPHSRIWTPWPRRCRRSAGCLGCSRPACTLRRSMFCSQTGPTPTASCTPRCKARPRTARSGLRAPKRKHGKGA